MLSLGAVLKGTKVTYLLYKVNIIDIESIDTKSDSVHWDLSWSVSWSTRSSATDDLGDYLSVDHPYVLKSTDYLKSEIHIYCTGLFSLVYRIALGIYAF